MFNLALSPAAWDLVSFLKGTGNYAQIAGGALLVLLGIIGVVWGGVLAVRKLMGGQQNNDSWIKIAALIIVGGAFLAGGWTFILMLSSGGQKTITDLGAGAISLAGALGF